jgi:hypothetical protein
MMSVRARLSTACILAALLVATAAPGASPASGAARAAPVAAPARVVVPVHHWRAFRTPSDNIACLYDSGQLRCDILSGLQPEPTKPCRFFWKGAMLPAAGRASYLCIIDTVYDPDAPHLRYGSSWKRHGIVCQSRTTGLWCHNPDRHGFRLSRRVSTAW